MPIIQLPDGNSVNVPDDASPEVHAQIRAKIQQQIAGSGQPAPPQSLWEMAKGLGSDVARGAGKALTGMMEGAAAFNDTQSRFDTSKRGYNELTQKVEQQLPTPQGDSTSRQYVRAGLEGLGGAMTTGIPSVMGAISGVGGGLGGEAGKRLGGAPGQFIGNLAGGVGAGVIAGAASRARPQSAALAKEALEGFSPQEFEAAQAFMNKTKAARIDIDLAQALQAVTGREGNLTLLRNAVASRRQGDKVNTILNRQPEQLQQEAEMTLAGLPGTVYPGGKAQAANNLQEAATNAISQAKKTRTDLWESTLNDGIKALKASEGAKVSQAKAFADQAGVTLGQARAKVTQLTEELAKAKNLDQTSIQALNKKVEDSRKLIEDLQSFTLPRGVTTTNAGSYSTLPQRGQSIIYDSIGREVKREGLENAGLPQMKPAASFETLQAEKALKEAQTAAGRQELLQQQAQQQVKTALEGFNATERVPSTALQGLHAKLDELIAKFPGAVEGQELARLKANLTTPEGVLTDPAQINRIFTQFTTRLKSPDLKTAGMDAGTSKYLGGVITTLRDDLGNAFAPVRQANKTFESFTNDVVNPLRQGPVGRLAQPAGYHPETGAQISKLDGLLAEGTLVPGTHSPIRTVVRELYKVDKTAADDALKANLTTRIKEAMDSPVTEGGSSTNTDMAERLYKGLFKNPRQWQGLKDFIAESSKVKGADPTDVIRGMENLKQITHAMTSRPAAGGGLSGEDIKRLGGGSNTANVVRIASFLPANRAGEMIERATLGKTLSQFDAILTSPEGVKMLMELGRVPVMSKKAQVILGTYGASLGNPPGLMGYNPSE